MKKLICTLIAVSIIVPLYAQVESSFHKGNQYFKDADYEKALEAYQTVLDEGVESFELYYNLGNTHFRLQQYTEAIWHYEKARKINPSDEDVLANIVLVNGFFVDEVHDVPELALAVWWRQFIYGKSPNIWSVISLCFALACLLWALSFWLTNNTLNKTIKIIAIPLCIVGILAFILRISTLQYFEKQSEAILFETNANVYSEPSNNATQLFSIHEGIKVELLENQGQWSKIKLSNGEVGWLLKTSIRPI